MNDALLSNFRPRRARLVVMLSVFLLLSGLPALSPFLGAVEIPDATSTHWEGEALCKGRVKGAGRVRIQTTGALSVDDGDAFDYSDDLALKLSGTLLQDGRILEVTLDSGTIAQLELDLAAVLQAEFLAAGVDPGITALTIDRETIKTRARVKLPRQLPVRVKWIFKARFTATTALGLRPGRVKLRGLLDTSTGSGDPGDPGDPGVPADILAMELEALSQINQQRIANGVPALIMDDTLRQVARDHSQDMIDRDFFSHTNPDGESPFDRLHNAGVSYTAAGENIAWNRGFADPVATAVNSWMQSAGHRANILNVSFEHTGMGIARSGEGIGAEYFFTQVFVRFASPLGPVQIELEVLGSVPAE